MSMHRKIAKIESTMLGYEDHGILTCYLSLDYGGSGQGFGGYVFDTPTSNGRRGTEYGMEFIARILKACGVDSWEKLKGRTVYALTEDDSWGAPLLGLEPLPTENGKRFLISELRQEMGIR